MNTGGMAGLRPACPSCGRPATATKSGHCIYCLRPLPEFASSIEPGDILRLSNFQRAREEHRRSWASRWMGMLVSMLVGILIALTMVGLFGVSLRWLAGLLTRGVRPA